MIIDWNKYKQLSKNEKEEYDFKFRNDGLLVFGPKWYFSILGFAYIILAIFLNSSNPNFGITRMLIICAIRFVTILAIADLIYLFVISFIENKWIKKHFKVIHK